MCFKSKSIRRFFSAWEDTWREWITPSPFAKYQDPYPQFPGSAFCIEQYALGMTIERFLYDNDEEIMQIPRGLMIVQDPKGGVNLDQSQLPQRNEGIYSQRWKINPAGTVSAFGPTPATQGADGGATGYYIYSSYGSSYPSSFSMAGVTSSFGSLGISYSSYGGSSYGGSSYGWAVTSYGISSYGGSSYGISSYGTTSYGTTSYGITSYGRSSYGLSSFGQYGSSFGSSSFGGNLLGVSSYNSSLTTITALPVEVTSIGMSSYLLQGSGSLPTGLSQSTSFYLGNGTVSSHLVTAADTPLFVVDSFGGVLMHYYSVNANRIH